jgi:glycyl-tRNA synthetase beta chain
MPRFVFEIGTEEIPPRFFPPALAQLGEDGRRMLEALRLSFGELKVYGTPRRLVLIVEGLAERQTPHTREERGPAKRVAFDGEDRPTKAALGFARRHGLSPDDLVVRATDQGDYVFAVVHEPELPAREALAGALSDLVTGLTFPKTMRWGTGAMRFGRPIRWLLALVGDEVVEFELEGLRSGRETRGHPVLADGMHSVPRAADYEDILRSHSVIVSPEERRAEIAQRVGAIAESESARVVDGGLLDETTFLVEYPTAARGAFDPDFLGLPRPVLIEEMQHVQAYFPLETEKGELLPKFVAVRDGGEDSLETVLSGWESVLRAKLIDASYFYQQDLKRSLAERVDDLKGVVFQERLGSVFDKAQRVRAVAAAAADQAALSAEERERLDRAAALCKADLTTEVVLDLSNLQGAMGREYALASGEPAQVADAIGEHYRPRSADDALPETKLGRLLAVSDKLDTLAALFAVGVVPSGSADPYGLRREAYGVVNILIAAGEAKQEERFALSLSCLLGAAVEALRGQADLDRPRKEVATEVMDFIRERLSVYLRGEGIRYDLVDAALAVGIDDISQAATRAQALRFAAAWDRAPKHPVPFLTTVIACTRPMNISKDFEGGEVNPDLFQEPAEKALWQAYQRVAYQADAVPLLGLFELIAKELREPIDRYFDDVLVMAEDEKLRRNRLVVCWHLSQLFSRIADFSLVVQD